ncbi:STAS domain-containing protein [Nocardioides litoris]|uniref:STAS domain-containing protein n=1 Tax=Nocardioides litoris TaxID=1926648 RepID=UPI00147751A8|nr:STAS domain-containing protein [Nocardioides litoris]
MTDQPDDGGVLTLTGDVEESALPELREQVAELLDSYQVVRVELVEVTFLPSAALGVLVQAAGRAQRRGQGFAIVAEPGSHAARVLDVTGVPYVGPG